jgi:hypothetical protein
MASDLGGEEEAGSSAAGCKGSVVLRMEDDRSAAGAVQRRAVGRSHGSSEIRREDKIALWGNVTSSSCQHEASVGDMCVCVMEAIQWPQTKRMRRG